MAPLQINLSLFITIKQMKSDQAHLKIALGSNQLFVSYFRKTRCSFRNIFVALFSDKNRALSLAPIFL